MFIKSILRNWHVKAICFIIAIIIVFLNRTISLKEEPVVVFLDVISNSNYTFTEALPSKVTLKLRGDESEIEKVSLDDLGAFVDISKIDTSGVYTLPIEINQERILDKTRNLEITASPVSITTTIEEKITKYLLVEGVTTGIPAHGYELSGSYINPSRISITGPKSHLQGLDHIKTDPIDISGKETGFNLRVKLNRADPLIEFPEGEFVEYRGVISETTAVKVVENVNIAVKGLNPVLELKTDIPQITVSVEGKSLGLENFTKKNIALTINLSNIEEPGTYEVPISHWTPRAFHVFNKSLDRLIVVLVEREEE